MRLNAYLHIDGKCEEAFRFYERCFGGKIELLMRYGDSPMAEETPPAHRDRIMHVRLAFDGNVLMGSDCPPGFEEPRQGFSLSLIVQDLGEAERLFRELAEGGTVRMAMAETFWSRRFGMVVDRFGTPWMVSCEKPM
jgi:PhnB protein